MLDFLLYYLGIGVILSIFLNLTLWAMNRPLLGGLETFACFILWPTVISSFINTMNGIEEEIEEE